MHVCDYAPQRNLRSPSLNRKHDTTPYLLSEPDIKCSTQPEVCKYAHDSQGIHANNALPCLHGQQVGTGGIIFTASMCSSLQMCPECMFEKRIFDHQLCQSQPTDWHGKQFVRIPNKFPLPTQHCGSVEKLIMPFR